MGEPISRSRSGIVHFFQAISKTFGGGDRRFESSRKSFISLERYILRRVSGREPSNLRSRRGSVEFFLRYGFQKGTMPPRLPNRCLILGSQCMRNRICLSKKNVSCAPPISPEQLSCAMLNIQKKTFWRTPLIKLWNRGNTSPHLKAHMEARSIAD